MSTALVSLVLGERYQSQFQRLSRPTWEAYAARHDYDLVVFDQPLDTSERARARSPSWQKCLVFEDAAVRGYDQVVWLDSDIVINARQAPAVAESVPLDKVGAVDSYSAPTAAVHQAVRERFFDYVARSGGAAIDDATAEQYYTNFGLPSGFRHVVQGGVLVASPRRHAALFRRVYDHYEDRGGAQWHYEMRPLGYELMRHGVVHWLDHRFNRIWIEEKVHSYPFLLEKPRRSIGRSLRSRLGLGDRRTQVLRTCVTTAFLNSYFLHFAGGARADMNHIDTAARSVWSLELELDRLRL